MACEIKTLFVLHILLLSATCYMTHCVNGQSSPQVPCVFIFGDSMSDNGNNNNLPTNAKANYKPYGIDFSTGPSGRFTNGNTSTDIIVNLLGLVDFIPPYANTSGANILKGVNYASGSAGIRYETGTHLGSNVPLGSQIRNHRIIVSKIAVMLGGFSEATKYLKKCLYYVNIGSNDYINNYYMPQFYQTSRFYTRQQYVQVLINQLSHSLQVLHDAGARKVVLVGLGLLGCTPRAIAMQGTSGLCVEQYNADALSFSQSIRSLVERFNNIHLDSKSIFINSTAGTVDSSLGFTVFNASCCRQRSDGMCIADSIPCPNRNVFVFFDGFHTTSAWNYLIAITSYDNSSIPEKAYPMDIKRLAQYPIN